ncbi:CD48 antigen-like [Mustelus asterias]
MSYLRLLLGIGLTCTEVGQEEVLAAVGSSPSLDLKIDEDLRSIDVIWEFTDNGGNLFTIFDYAPNLPKQEPNEQFEFRLYYNVSTGALTVMNVTSRDEGIYKITTGGELRGRRILKLIDPLSEPSINGTCVNGTIELTCQVPAGKASSILWWKDSRMITNSQRHQLMRSNSTLIIFKADKLDFVIYTCTMENPVSRKNCSFSPSVYWNTLSVYGKECEPSEPANNVQIIVISTVVVFIAALVIMCLICKIKKWKTGRQPYSYPVSRQHEISEPKSRSADLEV